MQGVIKSIAPPKKAHLHCRSNKEKQYNPRKLAPPKRRPNMERYLMQRDKMLHEMLVKYAEHVGTNKSEIIYRAVKHYLEEPNYKF